MSLRKNLERATSIIALIIFSLLCTHVASAQMGWSIKSSGTSAEILQEIVRVGKLQGTSFGAVEIEQADGPMPETAFQEITLRSGNEAIGSVRHGCSQLGLSEPATDLREAEPDLVCIGRRNGESVSVYAKVSCEDVCKLSIETRTLSF
ncbi:hypothetical protein G6L28_03170 [Agrobacterium larrymoorei]|uniref:hypothetical protein n=1 Tax=Agrobacterium larrymoorei TaxID=160699 RepID=UPI0015720CE8|nr:hypothetical protein [Agrobacterium larrymoorei]NTJ41599.1 hypothetical protein [Agrobacterium larrymoorei]